jgi:exopolysaccharide production protein ExoZ
MSLERSQHTTTQESKKSSIQALRGIAALVVAFYHARDLIGKDDPFKAEVEFLFNSGPAGVPLFFVISGFIMVYVTTGKSYSPTGVFKFAVKRFWRIWPTYAVITCAFYLLQYGRSANPEFLKNLGQSLCFIPLSTLDPPFLGAPVLSVGWTLNYEIYFYALISLSLFFSGYRWHVFFLIILFTLVIIPLTFGDFTFAADRTTDFGVGYLNMITNPIIWNFVYGVAIGLMYQHPLSSRWLSVIFSRKSILILALALVIWQYLSGFFGGFGPFQWGLGAVVLFTATLFYSGSRPVNFPSWLIRLGDISFSIYLLHIPILVVLTRIFRKIGYPAFESGTAMFFLTIAVTIVVSSFSYTYLEVGLSNGIKRLFVHRQRKAEEVNVDA